MLLNVMDIIDQFIETSNWDSREVYTFLVSHRRKVPRLLFKQFALNYRTYFHPQQRDRIFRDYTQLVMTKEQRHHSDLAIGYNIIKYVGVLPDQERVIIDFMATDLLKYNVSSHIIKKSLVLDIVEKRILKKKPL
jgi:hypothetical protein